MAVPFDEPVACLGLDEAGIVTEVLALLADREGGDPEIVDLDPAVALVLGRVVQLEEGARAAHVHRTAPAQQPTSYRAGAFCPTM
jgi:hypothetical protein